MSKGVIWASEYSLGPQIWGPGGPPGSATGYIGWMHANICDNNNLFRNYYDRHNMFNKQVIFHDPFAPHDSKNMAVTCKLLKLTPSLVEIDFSLLATLA